MTTTELLWQQIQTAPGTTLIYRRYPAVQPDIYAGLRGHPVSPERLLAFAFSDPLPTLPVTVKQLRDIRTEWVTDPLNNTRRLLLLTLLNPVLSDLFAIVCEDLVTQVANVTDQEQLASFLFDRLDRWQMLFDGYSPDGLSAEAQRGLFGELYFLRTLLAAGIDPARILTAWTGPAKASQDFGFPEAAIEVKTSIAVSPQSFQVSNARQLDDTGLNSLYVLFLSLNSLPDQGETLNQLIDDVTRTLAVDPALLNRFRLRLYEAGYFPDHGLRYDQPGYQVRVASHFRVGEGFPRLREADIPVGIGELQYSVSLVACAPFSVLQQEILHRLKTYILPHHDG